MDPVMLAALIEPIVAAAEPADGNVVVCAFRTMLRLQADAQNIIFAQAQANFKTAWNATYSDAELT